MIKALQKVGIEGRYLNIIKAIHNKPTANIILNDEKLKAFPLRSGTRKGCSLSPLFFNIILMSQRGKRNKSDPDWKRRKLSLFADDMIESPKDATRKLIELINKYSKFTRYNINLQKFLAFL